MVPGYSYRSAWTDPVEQRGPLAAFNVRNTHRTSWQSSGRSHGQMLVFGTWYKHLALVPFGLILNGRSKWIQLGKWGGMSRGLRTAPWGRLGRWSQRKRLWKWLSVSSWHLGGVLPFQTNKANTNWFWRECGSDVFSLGAHPIAWVWRFLLHTQSHCAH